MIDARCAVTAGRLAEPMAGTTSPAVSWVCIEQPGPWGRDALTESHLDPGLGRELAERARNTGVRLALIRHAGRHADRHRPEPRRVFVAHTRPGASWLDRATITDPKELLDLDFEAVGAGVSPGLGDRVTGPVLMVCTNGRRDVCCALWGRPIVAALAARHGEAVWECSHTGGHRFSPTGILLPTGYCYGRMDPASGDRLLTGRAVITEGCRGRSTWAPAGQVAELAVRELVGEDDPDTLLVGEQRSDQSVPVSHVDGRRWFVTVTESTGDTPRPPSCGAELVAPVTLRASLITTGPAGR